MSQFIEVINQWTETSNTKVNNVPLLCMVETDEERKPLNAQCGKWHGLMRFANIAKTHYNVEVQQAKGAVIARVTIPNQVRPAKVAFYLKTDAAWSITQHVWDSLSTGLSVEQAVQQLAK